MDMPAEQATGSPAQGCQAASSGMRKLRLPACVEDINYRQPRGLDRNLVVHLAACDWIGSSQNALITGPKGVDYRLSWDDAV